MESLAWVLILAAALIGRQVIVGRAANLREDSHDFFLAAFRGEGAKLTEVAKRRGKSSAQVAAESVSVAPVSHSGGSSNSGTALIAEMKRLAIAADNRYGWGRTGPDSYDCSGLVWRAMKNLGIFTGPRFTTMTFGPSMTAAGKAYKVSSPQVGDIVNWSTRHMGIVVGPDRMFSALSTRSGITESSISGEKGTPDYWRLGEVREV